MNGLPPGRRIVQPPAPPAPLPPAPEPAPPAPLPPAPDSAPEPRDEGDGSRGVALLLGAVAVLAAVIAARSVGLASDAVDAWQESLRTEVKRSAAALEDIRYLYQAELPPTLLVIGARLEDDAFRSAAATTVDPGAASVLVLEADVAAGVVAAIEGSVPLASAPEYARPGGGVDLGRRLADLRAETPELVALDPDAAQAEGDRLAAKAGSMTWALLPLGFAALFGATAQPFGAARRWLLAAGTVAVAAGGVLALAVELLA